MLVNLLTGGMVFIAVNECASEKMRIQYICYKLHNYVTFTQHCNHICLQNLETQYVYVPVWNR